ncbi:hypothetical protein CC78DRAFT_169685 [Lojkania enalia]|uniref:Uncharacterized protein n=1 Tax=Lojkania enalia TaxID=147567 RepID=A0A9P4N791_9PLEO|nr:hypothetical protein CC78DRAFT_169685 [Didymosphaeria enalia]
MPPAGPNSHGAEACEPSPPGSPSFTAIEAARLNVRPRLSLLQSPFLYRFQSFSTSLTACLSAANPFLRTLVLDIRLISVSARYYSPAGHTRFGFACKFFASNPTHRSGNERYSTVSRRQSSTQTLQSTSHSLAIIFPLIIDRLLEAHFLANSSLS